MPVHHAYDPADGVLVVTVTGHPPLLELRLYAARMATDQSMPASAPVLVLAHGNLTPPPPWELPGMAGVVAKVRERFGRRVAAVTATVGMATTVHLIAILAGRGDQVSAFTCEQAARRWLLAPDK